MRPYHPCLGCGLEVPHLLQSVRRQFQLFLSTGVTPPRSAASATRSRSSASFFDAIDHAREWLAQNAASGYLTYDPASRRFELPPEQAMVFANDESPFFMGGGFDAVAALYQTQPLVEEAFKSGGGVNWGDHAGCLFCAIGAMLRPRYSANIVQNWLPALDGEWPSWNGVPRSLISAAALVIRPSSWPGHFQTQPLSVTTSTSHRLSTPRPMRARVAVPATSDFRWPRQRIFPPRISTW